MNFYGGKIYRWYDFEMASRINIKEWEARKWRTQRPIENESHLMMTNLKFILSDFLKYYKKCWFFYLFVVALEQC